SGLGLSAVPLTASRSHCSNINHHLPWALSPASCNHPVVKSVQGECPERKRAGRVYAETSRNAVRCSARFFVGWHHSLRPVSGGSVGDRFPPVERTGGSFLRS